MCGSTGRSREGGLGIVGASPERSLEEVVNLLELAMARNADIEREVRQPGYLMSHELRRSRRSRQRRRRGSPEDEIVAFGEQ